MSALFLTFLFIPAWIIFGLFISSFKWNSFVFSDFSLLEIMAIYLLHFALSGIYISSYPAAQAISPSLHILLMCRGDAQGGLTKEKMLQRFTRLHIVEERVKDLVNTGMVKQEDGKFTLTFWGNLIVSSAILYRRLLDLDLKGG